MGTVPAVFSDPLAGRVQQHLRNCMTPIEIAGHLRDEGYSIAEAAQAFRANQFEVREEQQELKLKEGNGWRSVTWGGGITQSLRKMMRWAGI